MAKQTLKHTQAVINYYESTEAEYRVLWRNQRSMGLHFGYYDEAHTSHDAAVLNLNAQIAKKLQLTEKDVVLDAGCGVGGSSVWLAKNIGCKAVGISIVPKQIEVAKENAVSHNAADKASFLVADYADTHLASESFSVFWGLESIVHAQDKQAVIDEAYRLLEKGGQLVIAEYILEDRNFSQEETELLHKWLDGWAMPSLKSETDYRQMFEKSGFRDIETSDWTEHVMPSLDRLDAFGKKIRVIAPLLSALRIVNDTQRGNLSATQAQMELLRMGSWRYKVMIATKD